MTAVPRTETLPCRGCGNVDPGGVAHVYGERKCCPDCDHRPLLRLFHYTCEHGAEGIDRDGFLLPNPPANPGVMLEPDGVDSAHWPG